MMKVNMLVGVLGLMFVSGMVSADPLQDFLARKVPAQAQFEQHNTETDQRSTGVVVIGPQGKLRWEEHTPYRQTIVSNGQQAWQIDDDLEQAVQWNPQEAQGWMAALNSTAAAKKMYGRKQGTKQEVVLTPKQGSDAPKLHIFFDAHGYPERVALGEPVDNVIVLRNWRPAPQAIFDYQPAAHMDVLREGGALQKTQ